MGDTKVAAILINPQGKFILQQRDEEPELGKWVLFGGSVEKGESDEEALVREIKEQLGYEIKKLELFKVFELKEVSHPTYVVFDQLNENDLVLNEGADMKVVAPKDLDSIDFGFNYGRILKGFVRSLAPQREVSVGIFYNGDGYIWVQDRRGMSKAGETLGFWGGGVDSGETKEDALVRELKEELGFVVDDYEYWKSPKYIVRLLNGKFFFVTANVFLLPYTPRLETCVVNEGDGIVKIHIDEAVEREGEFGVWSLNADIREKLKSLEAGA